MPNEITKQIELLDVETNSTSRLASVEATDDVTLNGTYTTIRGDEEITIQIDDQNISINGEKIVVLQQITNGFEVKWNQKTYHIVEAKDYILEVQHLKQYFPLDTNFFGKTTTYLKAVDDVSFNIERGKTLGIVGESGCGKTTLGRSILKVYEMTGGDVFFDGRNLNEVKGQDLRDLRCDLQLIFQDPYSSLPPRQTVGEIIGEAVKVHHIVPKNEVKSYVREIMRKCGLQEHYYDRYPHEFSGGQRQRICIARALAVKPKLVICDEPVSALDVSIQAQIINLLKQLQIEMGLTYIFISHDLSVVKYISDEIGVMYLGSLVEKGTKTEIFKNPKHPYTQALFSAVPVPDPKVKMNRIILSGDIPSPANPPQGCKFHTRCQKCMKVCESVAPKFIEIEPNHFVSCHLYDKGNVDEEKEA
ncbi:MAG: dipeptide ABC transporter ATP-binding protein [Anaeroplasma bactoclasticum]|nr:dipeptide ABC transporter ATP-binding protein [Anaeroplasma bactoclasticum]